MYGLVVHVGGGGQIRVDQSADARCPTGDIEYSLSLYYAFLRGAHLSGKRMSSVAEVLARLSANSAHCVDLPQRSMPSNRMKAPRGRTSPDIRNRENDTGTEMGFFVKFIAVSTRRMRSALQNQKIPPHERGFYYCCVCVSGLSLSLSLSLSLVLSLIAAISGP